ncbi:Amino Acid-Polyamine-Organocation (APC) Family [Thraustotheca clavata]|uniref:Amino Acid-Polyamine-Organocation (APC) Family n=1 Tax=Thraustotheca clavata TaxID=74557 RepID=A0A1V9Z6Y1_9STRA|nr:Amino Acid-Polyamine-Organocation (APC) Family [Thraustotheca clavata]
MKWTNFRARKQYQPRRILPVASGRENTHPSRTETSQERTNSSSVKVEECVEYAMSDKDKASSIHIWALGVVAVMGGQLYGWNAAFASGFLPFALSQVITGLAYIIYMSSAAEVSGKIAFSGGSYGLARITLGYYCGFMVGFLELLEYVASASVSVRYVGDFIITQFDLDPLYQFWIWALFYIVFIGIFQLHGRIYWNFMVFFALSCLLPTILYFFATVGSANLSKYAAMDENGTQYNATGAKVWASGDISSSYFAWLPYTTWAYAGVESVTLVTSTTINPKQSMPRGMMLSTYTLFASNALLLFLVPSIAPGIATCLDDNFPLNNGFANLGISEVLGQWLILPAQMGMAAGFFLPYSYLTQALANSNLLPSSLGLKNQTSTFRCMVASSLFGYFLCVLGYFSPEFQSAMQNLFILAATFCYGAQLVGFVMLRTTYHTETSGYSSPFGIKGAIFSGLIYLLIALSIAGGFQGDNGIAVIALLGFIVLLTLYYHFICKHGQSLSKDEYATVFRFSVMKYNSLRSNRKPRPVHRSSIDHEGIAFLRRLSAKT